jgi:hypothetical protein
VKNLAGAVAAEERAVKDVNSELKRAVIGAVAEATRPPQHWRTAQFFLRFVLAASYNHSLVDIARNH